MCKTDAQRRTRRNSKGGQEAMHMPAGSGAMLTCKVPVERLMPCVVVLVHGVNDDGHCYELLDKGICAGLRTRLGSGEDDIFAHTWGNAPYRNPGSKGIVNEGRLPILPFYWGYHPVNHATFRQEQRRYEQELGRGRGGGSLDGVELPYGTYWVDGTREPARWPGTDSFRWKAILGTFTRTEIFNDWDYTHAAYKNPHRIYMAHAAQRLAALIARIRANPKTKDHVINIVAHSQGTLISMLANLMVPSPISAPCQAECLILVHSPYSVEMSGPEAAQDGQHQTRHASEQSLANLSCLLWSQSKQASMERVAP